MKEQKPYLKRMHEFLKTRINISDNELAGKSVDELKLLLPKPPDIRSPQEGFEVFDLLHSEPDAPRVAFRNVYLFPDGARCDIPAGQFFRTENPPENKYRRASAIVAYWEERLRPVQTEFDRLQLRIQKNPPPGGHRTQQNLQRLRELYATLKPWTEKLAEVQDAKEKSDPKYKTPERRAQEEALNQQIHAQQEQIAKEAAALTL